MTEEKGKITRRSYLKYAGAGVVVVAVAGAGAYYATQPPAPTPTTTTAPATTAPATTKTTAPATTAPAQPPYTGIELVEASLSASISKGLYWGRDDAGWEKATGAKLSVTEVPFADFAEKVLTDFVTGAGQFDLVQTGAWMYADWLATMPGYIIPITDYMKETVPPTTYDWHKEKWFPGCGVKYPYWDPEEVLPNLKVQCMWEGVWYGIPYDNDHFPMFLRRDLIGDPHLGVPANAAMAEKFKAKYGYDLAPPETWDQYLDVATFFTGWDWDPSRPGDKYGTAAALRRSTQGYFWYVGLATSFSVLKGPIVDKYHWVWEFDPETMEPLINQPGNVRALEYLAKLYKASMPESAINWDLGQAWDLFFRGNCALQWNAPDVPALSQDPEKSVVQGKCTTWPLPGPMEVWDRENKAWKKLDAPNKIVVCMGGSWHNVISKYSKAPDVAYHFSSWLNQEPVMKILSSAGVYGVDPGRYYMFPEPWGTEPASLPTYKATFPGRPWTWDTNDALSELNTYAAEFIGTPKGSAKEFYLPFRLPGSTRYQDAMDLHMNEAMIGVASAQKALDACYKDWDKITEDFGRDKQIERYKRAVGYGKPIGYGL